MKTYSAQKIHTMAKNQSKLKLNIVGPISSLGLLVNVCGRKKWDVLLKKKNNKSCGVDVVLWEASYWGVGARRGSQKP